MKAKYLLIGIFLWVNAYTAAAQCAMCRAVVENEASGQTAEGLNNGIVYLMAIPYLLVVGVGYVIYRKMRN